MLTSTFVLTEDPNLSVSTEYWNKSDSRRVLSELLVEFCRLQMASLCRPNLLAAVA